MGCSTAGLLRASRNLVTNLSSVTSSKNLKCWSFVMFRILRKSVSNFSLSCTAPKLQNVSPSGQAYKKVSL